MKSDVVFRAALSPPQRCLPAVAAADFCSLLKALTAFVSVFTRAHLRTPSPPPGLLPLAWATLLALPWLGALDRESFHTPLPFFEAPPVEVLGPIVFMRVHGFGIAATSGEVRRPEIDDAVPATAAVAATG